MRNLTGLLGLGALLLSQVLMAATETPVGVSPGMEKNFSQVDSRCPTFNWAGVAGSSSYELVVYRIGGEDEEATPILRKVVPGAATGWTPSLERCLERGGQYAWSVRAESGGVGGEWSVARLFRIASGPTIADVRAAIAVLEEYERGTAASDRGTAASAPRPEALGRPVTPFPEVALDSPEANGGQVFLLNNRGLLITSLGAPTTSAAGVHGLVGPGDAMTLKFGLLGEVRGDRPDSFNTVGVYGFINSEAGYGVRGDASSSTGTATAVLGITNSPDGLGGDFINMAGGVALRISVGPLQFQPTDSMPACTEGNLYFDDSENWLCICDGTVFRRADDHTACG